MTDRLSRRALSRRTLAGAALIAAPAAACATVLDVHESLDWAWRAHVATIQARSLDELAKTITSGDTLVFIPPNGALTTTKREYMDFHRTWFASTTWTMDFEPVWTKQSITMGLVLFRTHYRDVENGTPVETYNHLLMAFERERTGWKLVSDQNTRIPT